MEKVLKVTGNLTFAGLFIIVSSLVVMWTLPEIHVDELIPTFTQQEVELLPAEVAIEDFDKGAPFTGEGGTHKNDVIQALGMPDQTFEGERLAGNEYILLESLIYKDVEGSNITIGLVEGKVTDTIIWKSN